MKALAALLCALLATAAFAGNLKWKGGSREQEPEIGYIAVSDDGSEDFAAIVESHLNKGLSIRHLYLARSWIKDRVLQDQLQSIIRQTSSGELGDAIRSAGNMNNPKVTALRPVVCRAFLQTDLVRRLNAVLETHGLKIEKVSIEKLMMTKVVGTAHLDGIVWLIIHKKK